MSRSERRIRNNKIRRRRERRKNILLTVLTLCLVISLSFMADGFLSNAETDSSQVEFKYYKSIMVEQGDTLWSIVNDYIGTDVDTEAFVNEIRQLNGIHGDMITTGSYLVVPYYSNDFLTSE